jgi:3-phytase
MQLNVVIKDPVWKSKCIPADNIDSIAVWNNKVFVTAKSTHMIHIYNKENPDIIKKFGSFGSNPNQLNRPNGIFVKDDYLFVVERDNKRLQIFNLPSLKSVKIITGFTKPYGIWVEKVNSIYQVYITDDGNKAIYKVILDEKLQTSKTILFHKFNYSIKLESILVDSMYKHVILSDEKKHRIIILNMDGQFKKIIASDIFKGEPEGIALYKDHYIFTDQGKKYNYYHFITRNDHTYTKSLVIPTVTNTDGICVYNDDLYVIDNDCSLVKVQLNDSIFNNITFGILVVMSITLFARII